MFNARHLLAVVTVLALLATATACMHGTGPSDTGNGTDSAVPVDQAGVSERSPLLGSVFIPDKQIDINGNESYTTPDH